MKRAFLYLGILALLMGNGFVYVRTVSGAETTYRAIAEGTLLPLFEALKKGDVETIKESISGDMYGRYKTLLEQNKDYPEFLRNFYLGATFRMEHVVASDGDIIVDVTIDLPNSGTHFTKFFIRKATSNSQGEDIPGDWKVVKEIKK
jgi:hypothetical protein